MRETEID
ncbi:hypothetical protein CGLO_00342 [Colletotrichum gloeosporioides Cg-14]|nr:hypothetical protein CGLO_00342 [Colletotrichum gloeosporioides Cg-14]